LRRIAVKAVFVELPAFARHRSEYLDEERFRLLQKLLLAHPTAGDVIQGSGGLRKLRFGDARRGKGKRGGLRIVYYWWSAGSQFWLFSLFGKDEASDLSAEQRARLKAGIEREVAARRRG
jgi:hypothetical protein